MWKSTEVSRRLNLAAPIIQGPFGGGLSSVELVVAVCEAGGLGSFGVHHLAGAQIREVAHNIRSRTQRPFALNLWIPFQDSEHPSLSAEEFARNVERLTPYYNELGMPPPVRPERFTPSYAEQVEAVLEARPAAFSFVYGVPSAEVLRRCRELEIVTIGAATTADEALALERAGVDLIVATGFEAGGHRVSFLRAAEHSLTGTFALVPQVVDAVKVPVIAAGGIADGRGIAAALALGAQGVQIGTAFLACAESAASEVHRRMLFSPEAKHTALTRAFSGRLARGIRNRFIDELRAEEANLPQYPVQNWFTGAIKAAAIAQDRADLISLWAGQAAPLLRHRDAQALMQALLEEASAVLDRA
ncbi:nitronate monooxygenase family protein [Pseudomonas sp. 2FG]|uniref:NAD(P)H-dependent flavin oxidoreductase n=1 Tax=Pseudomonas sp. 2FG TaxID=2502191 RepID=UPI0010F836F1|nr:nitronate monooxygenase [Pseudomonas sp. 2FG]